MKRPYKTTKLLLAMMVYCVISINGTPQTWVWKNYHISSFPLSQMYFNCTFLCCKAGKILNSNHFLELSTLLRITQTLRSFMWQVSNRERISNRQAIMPSSPSLHGAVKASSCTSSMPRGKPQHLRILLLKLTTDTVPPGLLPGGGPRSYYSQTGNYQFFPRLGEISLLLLSTTSFPSFEHNPYNMLNTTDFGPCNTTHSLFREESIPFFFGIQERESKGKINTVSQQITLPHLSARIK